MGNCLSSRRSSEKYPSSSKIQPPKRRTSTSQVNQSAKQNGHSVQQPTPVVKKAENRPPQNDEYRKPQAPRPVATPSGPVRPDHGISKASSTSNRPETTTEVPLGDYIQQRPSGTPVKIPQNRDISLEADSPTGSPASFKGFLTERDTSKMASDKTVDWPLAATGESRVQETAPIYMHEEKENERLPSIVNVVHDAHPPPMQQSVSMESEKAEIVAAIKNRKKLRDGKSMARSDSDSSNGSLQPPAHRRLDSSQKYRNHSVGSVASNGSYREPASPRQTGYQSRGSSEAATGIAHRNASLGSRSGLGSVRETDSGARPAGLHVTKSGSLSGAPGETGQNGGDLYEVIGNLGTGSTGVMKIMRDRRTKDLVAAKWVQHTQGEALSVQLEREIVNHRRLLHPNIIRFREVFATDEHLVIVMDYASIGPLSERITSGGSLREDTAKLLFRQLVDGMVYCHKQGVVHRNLTLANLLLDGHAGKPTVKISGFAYSKAPDLDSAPKSAVTAPMFLAPEVLMGSQRGRAYDGRASDVWACGIILFTMVTGEAPFKDKTATGMQVAFKTTQKILSCDYEYPRGLSLSHEARDLLANIFVADPKKRIDSYALANHAWLSGAALAPPRIEPILISTQTESDISSVMDRARKRREARLKAQRERAQSPEHFNEDLLND